MRELSRHWTEIDPNDWLLDYFLPSELASKDSGLLYVHPRLAEFLDVFRRGLGGALITSSCYRTPQHNAAVNGKRWSQHQFGLAVDCRVENHDPEKMIALARQLGVKRIGTYPYARQPFIHFDLGGPETHAPAAATWGRKFKPRIGLDKFDEESDKRDAETEETIDKGTNIATVGPLAVVGGSALNEVSKQVDTADGILKSLQTYGVHMVVGVLVAVGALYWVWAKRGWISLMWRRLIG